ncbi:hypothetical protein [Streptomyces sp. NPDC054849]
MRFRLIGTAAMALAGTILAIAPAHAADEISTAEPIPAGDPYAAAAFDACEWVEDYAGQYAGEGCFKSYGDKIWVKDGKSDGLRVVVKWETNYGRTGECHQTGGTGSSGVCNYDMREDGKIRFSVMRRDGANGDNLNQSLWTSWLNIG